MAGVPKEVTRRANDILFNLTSPDHILPDGRKMVRPKIEGETGFQLNIFESEEHEIVKTVKALEVSKMTPLEALQKLDELKKIL